MLSESRPSWRVAAAILLLACIWLAMLLFGRGPLDRSLYLAIYAGGHPVLVGIARFFTEIGRPTVMVAAAVLWAGWLWWSGKSRVAWPVLLVIMVGRGLTEVQKFAIERARPTLDPHLVHVKTWSFPSGHAASSMIFFLTFALTLGLPQRYQRLAAGLAILTSLLIGTSRVMLGVHWPSDVIAGWSWGLLWVVLTLRFAEHLFEDSRKEPKRVQAPEGQQRGE